MEMSSSKRPLGDEELDESTSTFPETSKAFKTGKIGIEDLPSGVLTQILANLKLPDRKNARLVNKLWYDACNLMSILRTEKLYFSGIDNLPAILETLMSSHLRILTLHFHELKFVNYPLSFWEKCGPKIVSLDFSECHLSPETFELLFRYCCQLEHLSWLSNRYRNHPRGEDALCTNDQLDRITESKLVRTSLKSLNLVLGMAYSCWMSNYTLCKLLSIFPNIRKFGFVIYSTGPTFDICEQSDEELSARERISLSSVCHLIASQASILEELKLGFQAAAIYPHQCPTALACDFVTSVPDLTKLKKIDIHINSRSAPRSQILSFFSKQKFLESASLNIEFYESEDFNRDFLQLLLEQCPKLQHLDYNHSNVTYLTLDNALLQTFASCRLKTLMLIFDGIVIGSEILGSGNLPSNSNLKSFGCILEEEPMLPIVALKLFPNLKHIEFRDISEEGFRTILNYKGGLRSIKLTDCPLFHFLQTEDSDDTKKLDEYPFPYLKNLESLEVDNYVCSRFFVSEFKFPSMKYLRVSGRDGNKLPPDTLQMLAQNLPELEALNLKFEERLAYDSWIALCSSLKKLRYLWIQDELIECFEGNNHDKPCTCFPKYARFFEKCPSLCALIHEWGWGTEVYYREVIKNTVTKKSDFQMYNEYRVPGCVGWANF